MGLFGHSTSQSVLLEPFHPPIGLNAAFCMPHVETLVMKEKMWSFSGDDFSIQNSAGQDVVRCHGQAFSWRDRKGAFFYGRGTLGPLVDCDSTEFKDARQMPLFTVRNKVLAFHKTQLIEAMDGTDLCTVKKKFSSALLLPSLHSSFPCPFSSSSFAPPPTMD